MSEPSKQAQTLAETVGVRARTDLRLLCLRGEEQREWLNGQVTADVRDTKPGDGVYALVVNVRGKILSDAWVLDEGGRLEVLLPEASYESVREAFDKQIIMEDVDLADAPSTRVISLQGPAARTVAAELGEARTVACDELGHGGVFVLVDEQRLDACLSRAVEAATRANGGAVDHEGFELARIRAGRPWLGIDFSDRNYPQEAGLKGLAVSFNKGCYVGQEVVCTLEHRGKLSKRLVRLAAEGSTTISRGDALLDASEQVVGEITSVVADPEHGRALALGYVKHAHASPNARLRTPRASVLVLGVAGAD